MVSNEQTKNERDPAFPRSAQGMDRPQCDPFRVRAAQRGNTARRVFKLIWIDGPIDLRRTRKMRERVRFDAHTANPKFLTLDDRCARPAKRVEHLLPSRRWRSFQIVAHQVRRVRQNKAIPIVRGTIVVAQLVRVGGNPSL